MLEQISTGWRGVQLWLCDLDDSQVLSHCDESFLAMDELHRAERLRSERQRQLFLRRRALRRFLLGQFLRTSPRTICFVENIFGKPQLAQFSPARCEFSTSHSENVFAMAIAPESEIGVDVEVLRPDWNLKSFAAMCLNRRQITRLENFPRQERQKQFLRFWSLREAFAKASGDGIAQSSDEQISAEQVWNCIFNADSPLPDWNWIQQWHQIGRHDAVISVAQKSRNDFQNGCDFTDAFRKPFWPHGKLNSEAKSVVS
jgi:phosphopantetheinyl transferase